MLYKIDDNYSPKDLRKIIQNITINMKTVLQLLLLSQFMLLSCNLKKEKKTEFEKPVITESYSHTIDDSKNEESKTSEIDISKIREYAQQILENKITPSDDDETIECLNQLFVENQKDLNFYFNVFRVIVKKSDGALSEIIGQYIIRFLKSNPDFFIEKYLEFDSNEKDRLIGFMAYEFYFSDKDYKTEINDFFAEVSTGIKSKSESKTKILSEMKELVSKETGRVINE